MFVDNKPIDFLVLSDLDLEFAVENRRNDRFIRSIVGFPLWECAGILSAILIPE